jgi:CrcB protein
MTAIVLVGVGSFIGGVLRFGLSSWVYKALDKPWFPYGTLAVNLLGSLAIGFLAGLAEARSYFNPDLRLFVFVGILGGFTTFSAFALETLYLARETTSGAALVNIGLQVFLGLLFVWLGHFLGRAIGN